MDRNVFFFEPYDVQTTRLNNRSVSCCVFFLGETCLALCQSLVGVQAMLPYDDALLKQV